VPRPGWSSKAGPDSWSSGSARPTAGSPSAGGPTPSGRASTCCRTSRLEGAGIDLVHGHSSHHPKAIEVHDGRLILYGCGDFLDDYEGIRGYEAYRDDLVVMYFPTLDPDSGRLLRLDMTPLRICNMRLQRPRPDEVEWVAATLDRECRRSGARVRRTGSTLVLE
jgi:poly-gamma-glutamate capsule biosynthesis protein CapA/YwtB (metallophosphatase superfamily)